MYLNGQFKTKSFNAKAFKLFILECLRPEKVSSLQTSVDLIAAKNCKKAASLCVETDQVIKGSVALADKFNK